MKNNKSLMLGALGVTVGLVAGLSGSTLYTQAQTTSADSNANTTSIVERMRSRRRKSNLSEEQIAKRESIRDAMEDGNYDSWKSAIEGSKKSEELLEKINTQEKFDKLVEAKRIMQDARNRSNTILDELGIERKQYIKGMNAKSNE
ncbi:MAG: hypothetical protein AAGF07_03995 [Patescibacteria group bacterium]